MMAWVPIEVLLPPHACFPAPVWLNSVADPARVDRKLAADYRVIKEIFSRGDMAISKVYGTTSQWLCFVV